MPSIRDVAVHVTDADGRELSEWGVQTFRRNNTVSCYIESKTGMPFRVSLQPKIPYIAYDKPSGHGYNTRHRGEDEPGRFQVPDEWVDKVESGDEGTSSRVGASFSEKWKKQKHKAGPPVRCTPIEVDHNEIPPPNFHLIAALYLDGRTKPERRVILYLNPKDPDFAKPSGLVTFKYRQVEGRDGQLRNFAWHFAEVGIETLFDRMVLEGNHDTSTAVAAKAEDDLVTAMNSTAIDPELADAPSPKAWAGRIVVKLMRVKLGQVWQDEDFHARHREGDREDVDMRDSAELSHTTE